MRIRGHTVTAPRALLAGLLVATLLTGGYAAATSSASFGSHNPGWDGTRSLRLLADTHADTTIGQDTTAYDRADAPNTTAILLSPQSPFDPAETERVTTFLDRGGRLVVAGDFGTHTNHLLAGLGVTTRIDGQLVRDERFYHRSPALPVAGNVSGALATETDALTLNHGSVLHAGPNTTALVHTSGFAYLDANRNARLDDAESMRSYPVVAAEPVGNGTVVVASDPSIFINAMLERDGNRAFTTHLLSQRDRVLLDYSHTATLPLAAVVVHAIGDSWLLQALLGAVVLAAAGLLGESPGLGAHLRSLAGRGAAGEQREVVSSEAVVAAVAARHPEWDEATLRRVTQSIRTGLSEDSTDD